MRAIKNGEIEDTRWSKRVTKLNKIAGDRYNFKCNRCSKTIFLIHSTNGTAAIFLEEVDHQHTVTPVESKRYRIPERTRQKVDQSTNLDLCR